MKSYNQIKMCMCRDVMDIVMMVRYALGLKWVLFCCHLICCNSILHDLLSLYFDTFMDMAIFSFFLGPSCVQYFFFFLHLDLHVSLFFSIAMSLL
jgi:hypothetical protein